MHDEKIPRIIYHCETSRPSVDKVAIALLRETQTYVAWQGPDSRSGTCQSYMRVGDSSYNFAKSRLGAHFREDVPPLRPGNFTISCKNQTDVASTIRSCNREWRGHDPCLIHNVQALSMTAGLRKKHAHDTFVASSCSKHSKNHVHAARYRLQAQGSVGDWEP